jgi:hypothetical protein
MTTTHPLSLALAAELIGAAPTCTFCEIDGSVFRASPYAWDLALPQHAAHRPAFDALVAALAQEEADRLAAQEAARLEALANPPPAPTYHVSKDTLIARLTDEQVVALDDILLQQPRVLQIRWRDSEWFSSDNANVRALVAACGADVEMVMAVDAYL